MIEETFTRELERHADDIQSAPLSFEDVRGRARSIRRRRRGAAAAAVAAVVAITIIVPTVLTGGTDRSDSIDPAPEPPTTPGASVLHDRTLTLPSGETMPVDVDNDNVVQMGVLTDGRAVLALERPYAVRVYRPDGSLDGEYPVSNSVITMSAGDDAVAWVAKDLTVRVLASGAAEPATLPGIPSPNETAGSIDAVLDAEHLLVGDHATTTNLLTPTGLEDLPTSEPFRVGDVSPGGDLWAVSFTPAEGEQFGCSGLYDPGTDEVVARNCDTSGLRFSPDGQHLLGMRGDNNMSREASTFDLDLQEVGTFAPAGTLAVISRVGWADATHLLFGVTDWELGMTDLEANPWSLIRVGLDGSDPEVVVPEGPGGNPEFVAEFIPSN